MNDYNQNGQTLKEELRAKMDRLKGRALDTDTAVPVSGLSDNLHRRAFVGAAVLVGILAAVCFRRHLTPHTRHIPRLLHKHSKLQAFIRDYERMMRP